MTPANLQEEASELSPSVLAFLPLLYIAWADEVITPTEIDLIQRRILSQPWLEDDDKNWLSARLDPAHPPSQRQLQNWRKLMHQAAGDLPEKERRNLLSLARELANLGTAHKADQYKDEQSAQALRDIESALGLISTEALREMMAEARDMRRVPPPAIHPPLFDIAALQRWLDGPYLELKQQVRTLLSDPAFAYSRIPEDKAAYRHLVMEWLTHLANQGYGALSYPEAYGGKAEMGAYIAVFEILGHHDLSLLVKFGVQFGLFGGSILGLGTPKQHARYLPGAGNLKLPGCFAMTEAGHGSNVRDLETTAHYAPEQQEFVIHTPHHLAHKEYIGNAAVHGQLATVFAQLIIGEERYGVHAFVVPIRNQAGALMPGVRIEDSGRKLGLNGVDNGRIWFDQVRVPLENLLNRFAEVAADGTYTSPITSEGKRFFTMLSTLVGGRICVPLAGLSAAKNGLSTAIKYAVKRRQFGKADAPEMPIMDYPTHQRRLIPYLARTYALHTAHRYLVSRYLTHDPAETREIEALAAGLKAVSTWHTTEVLQECREACGGNGYLWINRLADLKADTEIFTTFEGDNIVLLQLVAKSRLTAFRQEFQSMNVFGMLGFLAQQAGQALADKNPFITRQTDPDHLRNPEWHLGMFRCREEDQVLQIAREMKRRIDEGESAFDAFLATQNSLVRMATRYIDRVVLEQFQAAIEGAPEESRAILGSLETLYALHNLWEDRAWFLENGYFEGRKSAAIEAEMDRISFELKGQAGHLVDAFGIPDALLGAPIALRYGLGE